MPPRVVDQRGANVLCELERVEAVPFLGS